MDRKLISALLGDGDVGGRSGKDVTVGGPVCGRHRSWRCEVEDWSLGGSTELSSPLASELTSDDIQLIDSSDVL